MNRTVLTHGRLHWLAAMMLFAMMLFAPQRAGAVVGSDWGSAYSFLYRYLIETDNLSGTNSKFTYNSNNNGNKPVMSEPLTTGFYTFPCKNRRLLSPF